VRTAFHSLVYLALGLWLGALVFFGAVLAPVAFSQLPPLFPTPAAGIHAAGLIVGDSLVRLHWMGLVCGLIFLVVSVFARAHYRTIVPQGILVLAMMLLTAYSQFFIIPRMDTAREAVGGNVAAVAANNPGRQIFDRLHQQSVHVESLVLLCGIAALFATTHCSREV
jgi:FtsH-binding integral membrane protein